MDDAGRRSRGSRMVDGKPRRETLRPRRAQELVHVRHGGPVEATGTVVDGDGVTRPCAAVLFGVHNEQGAALGDL